MATTVEEQRARDNGSGTPFERFNLEPPAGRRTRLPELAVGTALMISFSLAAVLWHMSATDKSPALALAAAVERGEVIEASDLRVVYVATDDRIAHLGTGDSPAVVGRVALSDLPEGTLLTRGSVAPLVALGPDDGVVGLALDPGQVPADLLQGDHVNVIAGPSQAGPAVQPDGRESAVLASRAEVYAIRDLGTQGRKVVSLKLAESDANRVAAAAERGPVRLVLVGR